MTLKLNNLNSEELIVINSSVNFMLIALTKKLIEKVRKEWVETV